jgi:hypothetical protein
VISKWQSVQIRLHEGWSDRSHENQGALATYVRDDSKVPGVLQVSVVFRGATPPELTMEKQIAIAVQLGTQPGFEQISTASGDCRFGHWGSAVFRSEGHRAQCWLLSNGRDAILVTHICQAEPDPAEIAEAQEIVEWMHLAERPWWRFWK